jgi:predicted PurR-regulated permease PerM
MGMGGDGTKTSKNVVIFFTIFIPFLALCGPQLLQQISESFCHLKSYFIIRKRGEHAN